MMTGDERAGGRERGERDWGGGVGGDIIESNQIRIIRVM